MGGGVTREPPHPGPVLPSGGPPDPLSAQPRLRAERLIHLGRGRGPGPGCSALPHRLPSGLQQACREATPSPGHAAVVNLPQCLSQSSKGMGLGRPGTAGSHAPDQPHKGSAMWSSPSHSADADLGQAWRAMLLYLLTPPSPSAVPTAWPTLPTACFLPIYLISKFLSFYFY